MSLRPLRNSGESVLLFLSPYDGQDRDWNEQIMVTAFILTRSAIFNNWPANQFFALANHFLVLLGEESRHLGRQGQTGVYSVISRRFSTTVTAGWLLVRRRKMLKVIMHQLQQLLNWVREGILGKKPTNRS